MGIVPVTEAESKHIHRKSSRIRLDLRIELTQQERAGFPHTLRYIWKINSIRYKYRYSKNILTYAELKIVKKKKKKKNLHVLNHLVTWIPYTDVCLIFYSAAMDMYEVN